MPFIAFKRCRIFFSTFNYTLKQCIFIPLYISDSSVASHHQAFFDKTRFISRQERVYFKILSSTLKRSARYELFAFLGIDASKVGTGGVIAGESPIDPYHGSLLPEESSNFPPGFRVMSFYVDPESLIKRAYVLRQNGWRDELGLYQRMIIPAKISSIRRYLREQHRVFANNIIVTLPDDTEIRDAGKTIIDSSEISQTTPAWIYIQARPNSVGIIDGQHRVFSYYEDLSPDPLIDKYRKQQNLLATGIIYPPGTSKTDKERFEAALFLEINSNQTSAKSDIIQAIWLILDPFKPISVAKNVVNGLASTASLGGLIQKNAYELERIPTTTVVTYGILPLVKRSGVDSIFSIWTDPDKSLITGNSKDPEVLKRYVKFCTATINEFLLGARIALGSQKWKMVSKDGEGVLSVTTINGLIILLRLLIQDGRFSVGGSLDYIKPINSVDFNSFKSSQYAALAKTLFETVV